MREWEREAPQKRGSNTNTREMEEDESHTEERKGPTEQNVADSQGRPDP